MSTREEIIAKLFAELDCHLRKASIAEIGGFRPPDNPITSCFGGPFVAQAGEEWPEWEGEPMLPLLQVRIDELPYCPPALDGIALFNVFIRRDRMPDPGTENGQMWVMRSYSSLEGLVPMVMPEGFRIRPFPVRWHLAESEGPTWEAALELSETMKQFSELEDSVDLFHDRYDQHGLTKIGGWIGTIQGSYGNPNFVFQISSEEKPGFMIGDNGNAYFSYENGKWVMDWDCY